MPQTFFAADLSGEQPLSLPTAQTLCGLAERFYSLQLWSRLHEDHLVFIHDPAWPEPHVCSVMGARGEVLALTVYLGYDGYHFFQALTRQLHDDPAAGAEAFFGEQSSVYVHYAPRAALTKPDRDLLRALGYPAVKAAPVPLFRAVRPGHYPWYQTEGEARLLIACLTAMLWFADRLSPDYWRREGMYPLLSPDATGYSLTSQKAPVPVPEKAPLDDPRIQHLRRRRLPVGAAWQMDYFCAPGMVGKKNERKICLRVALAVDAETGIVFPPAFAEPGARAGQVLSDSLLGAIATAGCRPSAVQMRDPRHALLLGPLARELAFPVVLRDSLPALDHAKAALFQFLGNR